MTNDKEKPPREWQEAVRQLKLLDEADCKTVLLRVSRVMLRSPGHDEEMFFKEIGRMLRALESMEPGGRISPTSNGGDRGDR